MENDEPNKLVHSPYFKYFRKYKKRFYKIETTLSKIEIQKLLDSF